jgi:hypothetical protein
MAITHPTRKSHMPENSILFEKVMPALLVLLGMITLGLILFAASVVFGFIQF